jgi:hypothetical protein
MNPVISCLVASIPAGTALTEQAAHREHAAAVQVHDRLWLELGSP